MVSGKIDNSKCIFQNLLSWFFEFEADMQAQMLA